MEREKHRIETAAGKRGQFPAQRKRSEMSHGCVEFGPNRRSWRILGEDECPVPLRSLHIGCRQLEFTPGQQQEKLSRSEEKKGGSDE
ncbi:MAG: hypothetical protein DMG61_08480 [Acidobacteria bacterium]|nr:MAG: hypothetical protein DMG61_08480 [Acidobacteriota bacterium]